MTLLDELDNKDKENKIEDQHEYMLGIELVFLKVKNNFIQTLIMNR